MLHKEDLKRLRIFLYGAIPLAILSYLGAYMDITTVNAQTIPLAGTIPAPSPEPMNQMNVHVTDPDGNPITATIGYHFMKPFEFYITDAETDANGNSEMPAYPYRDEQAYTTTVTGAPNIITEYSIKSQSALVNMQSRSASEETENQFAVTIAPYIQPAARTAEDLLNELTVIESTIDTSGDNTVAISATTESGVHAEIEFVGAGQSVVNLDGATLYETVVAAGDDQEITVGSFSAGKPSGTPLQVTAEIHGQHYSFTTNQELKPDEEHIIRINKDGMTADKIDMNDDGAVDPTDVVNPAPLESDTNPIAEPILDPDNDPIDPALPGSNEDLQKTFIPLVANTIATHATQE